MKIVVGGKDDLLDQDEIIESGKWEFNFKANKLEISKHKRGYILELAVMTQYVSFSFISYLDVLFDPCLLTNQFLNSLYPINITQT